MAKIGHPDEERTDGTGIPLHMRIEISVSGWKRRLFTTRASDVKELALALEIFQDEHLDAAHLDLHAFVEMAGLKLIRWPHKPRQYRRRR